MQAQALKIQDVRKSFGTVHVLKGIDIEIDPGEFLILSHVATPM
jgi:multiple sugar transport system ATP-binding protein